VVRPFEKDSREFENAVKLVLLLRDLSVTKQLLLGAMHHQEHLNPIEYAYRALGIKMKPLELETIDRACLQRMVDKTSDKGILVNQIFKLDDGKPPSAVGNKSLLFHGSKNANVVGILKQGLRIAPPEAPTTGYMYGKGLYFADQFTKAMSYSSGVQGGRASRAYVFVAEVALGEQHVAHTSDYRETAKDGTQSTFAPGGQEPNPELSITLDSSGTRVVLGALREQKELTRLTWDGGYTELRGLAAAVSEQIEAARLDSATKFPATVRFSHKESQYDVTLEGPMCSEATACKVDSEEQAMETDEPDMSAFLSQPQQRLVTQFKLTRRSAGSSGRSKQHSEFIVYDSSQVRLKYLIEVTTPAAVEREWKHAKAAADDASA